MMLNLHIYDSFGHLISLLVISLFSYCRINMYCRLLLQFSSLILPLLFKEMDGARICQVGTLCAKLVKKRFSSLCDVHWAEIHPIMSLSLVVIAEGAMFALSCSETLMGCWILCIYYQESEWMIQSWRNFLLQGNAPSSHANLPYEKSWMLFVIWLYSL